ncbi:MAG: RNA polymerase sigma factor (sigma-70 family), partial [Polaribacter sp.]
VDISEMHEQLASSLESDVYFSGDEIQQILQKAIATLPQKQRLVFNMKYFDEIKYHEMSEILETSVGALKASYFHAVKKIENYIKNKTD